jgi:uncharacterized protein YjbJ (UPF0337 family)
MVAWVSGSRLWRLVLATAKLAWGKLTNDYWLQLEGRRLKYPGLLQNNPAFARVRVLSRAPDRRAAPRA